MTKFHSNETCFQNFFVSSPKNSPKKQKYKIADIAQKYPSDGFPKYYHNDIIILFPWLPRWQKPGQGWSRPTPAVQTSTDWRASGVFLVRYLPIWTNSYMSSRIFINLQKKNCVKSCQPIGPINISQSGLQAMAIISNVSQSNKSEIFATDCKLWNKCK